MKRFALVFALVVVAAAVVAAGASALSFADDSSFACTTPDDVTWTCPTGTVGTPYSVQFQARSGCSPDFVEYSVASGGLPPGLTISPSGLLSGTPTQAGTWQTWMQVKDVPQSWCTDDRATQKLFIFNVQPGLDMEPASVPPGTVGTSYSAALTVTPTTSLTFSVTGGALPPGLSLAASTGVISGTPTAMGAFPFKIQAQASDGRSISREYTINVANPLAVAPLALEGQRSGRSEIGVALSGKLAATGGNGTLTWTVKSGSLPTGVTLGPDGTISGTPSAAGSYAFTAQVADVDGRTATVDQTIVVAPSLGIRTAALKSARVGKLYRSKLVTLGGVSPVTWTILGGKLPRGIRFQKQLGVFVGTPAPGVFHAKAKRVRALSFRVTVRATDALGVAAQKTLVLVVNRSL